MFDHDFERTKEFLRGKLPDYLRSRGINPDESFACLNPQHPDHRQSMNYNPHTHCVQCYGCGANYDIFALIGFDYGLNDFNAQYSKACELFLGQSPQPLHERTINFENAGAATFGLRKEPNFELKRDSYDSRSEPQAPAPSFSPLYPPRPQQNELSDNIKRPLNTPANYSSERDDGQYAANLPPAGGAVFGLTGNHYRQSNVSFISSSNERSYPDLTEPKYNYADYLRQAAAKVGLTDFFTRHGLSNEVITRLHLGYDESYAAGADAHTGEQILWRAVIFPYSDYGYTVYNCDSAAPDKLRRRGNVSIFNESALQHDGAVFVCEQELDALSLETLNYHAVALSTPAAARNLLELCSKSVGGSKRIFYICIQEDGAGAECVKTLCAGLYSLKQPFKKIDAAFPYQSLNQALMNARDSLSWRLSHLEEMLTFSTTPVLQTHEQYRFIDDATALSRLHLSAYLYALCAPCTVLRRTLRLIMQERLCRLITVTTAAAWQFICHDLTNDDATPTPLPFEAYPNARAVLLSASEERVALEEIRYAWSALRLQHEGSFTLAIDLTVFAQTQHAALIAKLQSLSAELGCGLLLLCPPQDQELCSSLCLQTIQVAQSDDGNELIFKSNSLNGRPLNFTRYAGL